MKLKFILLLIVLFSIFSPVSTKAQSAISLSTGISMDLNNSNKTFYHIPVSLQWMPFSNPKNPLFFEFDYAIPLASERNANAYTLNPSLPQEVTLQENIRAYLFSISLGFKIHLYTNKRNNSFYLNLLTGVCSQNFKVDYKNYDKSNYEVLNPDVNLNKGGMVASIAGVYNFHKRKQDMFLMLHVQSPPFQNSGDYPLSFKFVAPLQLTYGYTLFYNKRK